MCKLYKCHGAYHSLVRERERLLFAFHLFLRWDLGSMTGGKKLTNDRNDQNPVFRFLTRRR